MNKNRTLHPRHQIMLYWASQGLTSKAIAEEMEINPLSVRDAFAEIYLILDAKNKCHAVAIALENDLLGDFSPSGG